MRYAINARGVTKSFGAHRVLDAIDLRVPPGIVFSLLGGNGAGKTTFLEILTTLALPDAGEASVAGRDLFREPTAVRRAIGVTGQEVALDEMLTARENLTMFARLRRMPRRAAHRRADELLEEFDLDRHRDRRVHTFSGGMRRRLDLALSLIRRPAVLFLDEPTTGLDPRSREQVWRSVGDLTESGTTVLLTTQYLDEADRLADDIIVLHDGRIAAQGSAAQLKARMGSETAVLTFARPDETTRARHVLAQEQFPARTTSGALEVRTDGTASQVGRILRTLEDGGAPAGHLTLRRPTLDDVFFSLTDAAETGSTAEPGSPAGAVR